MSECEIIVKMDKHIKIKGGTYKQDLIRCRDCKHAEPSADHMVFCRLNQVVFCLDGFCNYGEKE